MRVFCVHTDQGKIERKKKRKTRKVRGNAERVVLIWDDGKKKRERGRGSLTRGEEC
jgi:hypothetical protein